MIKLITVIGINALADQALENLVARDLAKALGHKKPTKTLSLLVSILFLLL